MYDVFHVSMQKRAYDIKMMLEKDQIYRKRTTNLELSLNMPIPTQISKRWVKKGQQNNKVRILSCRALEIQTVHKSWAAGMFENIMNLEGNAKMVPLNAKSVSLTGRGMKPLHS